MGVCFFGSVSKGGRLRIQVSMSVCCGGRRLTNREEGGVPCGSASGFGRVSGSVTNQFEDGMTGILLLWERQSQDKPPGAFSASLGMSDGSRQQVRPLNSCSAEVVEGSSSNSGGKLPVFHHRSQSAANLLHGSLPKQLQGFLLL